MTDEKNTRSFRVECAIDGCDGQSGIRFTKRSLEEHGGPISEKQAWQRAYDEARENGLLVENRIDPVRWYCDDHAADNLDLKSDGEL